MSLDDVICQFFSKVYITASRMNTGDTFHHIIEKSIEDRVSYLNGLILSETTTLDGSLKCWLRRECLLDVLLLLYVECEKQGKYSKHCKNFASEIHDTILWLCSTRVNITDFENLLLTREGDFGSFSIVREKGSSTLYTMKVLRKDYINKCTGYSYVNERDLMIRSSSSWVPSMKYAFQDKDNLYFVMKNLPGVNLQMILTEHNKRLDETVVKFYISEVVLALQYVHSLGYVYRDIRPINVLVDETGHVKLSNFGFASKVGENIEVSHIMVGLEEYIPPEVLESTFNCTETCFLRHKAICNFEYDYWALGILTYELLFSFTPFVESSTYLIYKNILNYKQKLKFPQMVEILSDKCVDFLKSLLIDSQERLKEDKILNHSFIFDTDLNESPYIPHSDNFENINSSDNPLLTSSQSLLKTELHDMLPFMGFAYVQDDVCLEDSVLCSGASSVKQRIVNITEERNKFECELHKMSSMVKDLQVMVVKEQQDRELTEDLACSIIEDFKNTLDVQHEQQIYELKDKINYLENKLKIAQGNTYEVQNNSTGDKLPDISSIFQVLNDMKSLTKKFENRFIDARENAVRMQNCERQTKEIDLKIKCRKKNDSEDERLLETSAGDKEQDNLTAVCSSIVSEMEKLKLFISLTESEEKSQKEAIKKDFMENVEKSKDCVETLEKENIELLNQLKIQRKLCEKQKSELSDIKEKYLAAERKVEVVQKQTELQITSYNQELLEVKRQLEATEKKFKEHLQISTANETVVRHKSDIMKGKNEASTNNVPEELQKEIDILKKELEDTRLYSKHHNEQVQCLTNMFKCKETELLCAKKRTKHLEEQLEDALKTSTDTSGRCPYGCKRDIHKLESELNFLKEAGSILEQQVEDYEKVVTSMQDCINKLCIQRDELISRLYTCGGKVYVQELLLKQEATVFLEDEVLRLKEMVKKMDEIKAKTSEKKE